MTTTIDKEKFLKHKPILDGFVFYQDNGNDTVKIKTTNLVAISILNGINKSKVTL